MHVTGVGTAVGAVITGLIIADLLYRWKGGVAYTKAGGKFLGGESRLLAGRG